MDTFTNICADFGLVDEEGYTLSLRQAFCKIYYKWDQAKLQSFMNTLMAYECGQGMGEALFD